jgi:hypothetical protein
MKKQRELRVGAWVQIKSQAEILRTLDQHGRLEGMPFMPEMLAFCGKKLQVFKIAHKTCDYSGQPFRTRRLARAVHLETRCSGSAHGGCQAACLLFWKEDWLIRLDEDHHSASAGPRDQPQPASTPPSRCTESTLWDQVQVHSAGDETPTYVCQMTEVPAATKPLAWWDWRQYVKDYTSGNVPLTRILSSFVFWIYYSISEAGIGVGRPMRWFYDLISPLWRGSLFPRKAGFVPAGQPTPLVKLDLQPGELVRVKPHLEILKTVGADNKNRGMHWDAELVPYCGGTFRVRSRVSRIIGERTGKMMEMKNACIILDSAVCQARYSSCRLFCPKGMYPFWREAWLERVQQNQHSETGVAEPDEVGPSAHQANEALPTATQLGL